MPSENQSETLVTPTATGFVSCVVFVGAAVAIVFALVNSVHSGSVDFAHHYALIAYLSESLHAPPVGDPALHAMSYYPPLSHAIAAAVARIVGSPLLGMQVTALLALAILWGAVGFWFSTLPARLFVLFAIFFALLIGAAWAIDYELHGRELISHFLYSQVVAQSAALAVIAFAAIKLRAGWPLARIAWLFALSAPIVASLHLLPGLLLLATLAAGALLVALPRGRQILWKLLAVAALASVSLLAIVLNPTFRSMRKLSENNGSLPLNFAPSLVQLVALGTVVLIVSAALGYWWIRQEREGTGRQMSAVGLLSAYGLAVALLFLVQLAALAFGEGSEYAVRKYAFAMQLVLLLHAAVALALLAKGMRIHDSGIPYRTLGVVFPAACALGVMVPMFSASPVVVTLSSLMKTEAFLSGYRRLALTSDAGKSDYSIGIASQSSVFDYMFSIGILRASADPNGFNVLTGESPSQPATIGRVFTSPRSPWDSPKCRLHSGIDAINVVDAQCALAERLPCEGEIDFTDKGWLPVGTLSGFSLPWSQGRWTQSKNAAVICTPTRARVTALISAYGFVKNDHHQRLIVSSNGTTLLETTFTQDGEERVLAVPLPEACRPSCRLDLTLPDAVSPLSLGVSADARTLAVGIRRVTFK